MADVHEPSVCTLDCPDTCSLDVAVPDGRNGGAGTRTLNILGIGRHLVADDIAPPLRALAIYNHKPLLMHPGQHRLKRGLA